MRDDDDQDHRKQICKDAFADERFVIFLNPCHRDRTVAVCFVPKYDEAPTFLKKYIAPFLLDLGGALERSSWLSPLPSEMERLGDARPTYWRQYLRWRDIESVEIWTETDEQRKKLDELLPDAIAEIIAQHREQRREWTGE